MDLYIEDKSFYLDWGFPEKISHLRKKETIKFKLNIYIDNSSVDKDNIKLKFIEELNTLSETVYVSKSDYYWWCFDSCQLIDKKIAEDKNYSDYKGRDIKKINVELIISYKDVWGSNKKSVLERDMKLKKLFDI